MFDPLILSVNTRKKKRVDAESFLSFRFIPFTRRKKNDISIHKSEIGLDSKVSSFAE